MSMYVNCLFRHGKRCYVEQYKHSAVFQKTNKAILGNSKEDNIDIDKKTVEDYLQKTVSTSKKYKYLVQGMENLVNHTNDTDTMQKQLSFLLTKTEYLMRSNPVMKVTDSQYNGNIVCLLQLAVKNKNVKAIPLLVTYPEITHKCILYDRQEIWCTPAKCGLLAQAFAYKKEDKAVAEELLRGVQKMDVYDYSDLKDVADTEDEKEDEKNRWRASLLKKWGVQEQGKINELSQSALNILIALLFDNRAQLQTVLDNATEEAEGLGKNFVDKVTENTHLKQKELVQARVSNGVLYLALDQRLFKFKATMNQVDFQKKLDKSLNNITNKAITSYSELVGVARIADAKEGRHITWRALLLEQWEKRNNLLGTLERKILFGTKDDITNSFNNISDVKQLTGNEDMLKGITNENSAKMVLSYLLGLVLPYGKRNSVSRHWWRLDIVKNKVEEIKENIPSNKILLELCKKSVCASDISDTLLPKKKVVLSAKKYKTLMRHALVLDDLYKTCLRMPMLRKLRADKLLIVLEYDFLLYHQEIFMSMLSEGNILLTESEFTEFVAKAKEIDDDEKRQTGKTPWRVLLLNQEKNNIVIKSERIPFVEWLYLKNKDQFAGYVGNEMCKNSARVVMLQSEYDVFTKHANTLDYESKKQGGLAWREEAILEAIERKDIEIFEKESSQQKDKEEED